jgi:membrane dipeptidase
MEVTAVPAIASHSSARHFTPGYERNMSDDLISLLAKNGGVIQINFGSSFITAEAQQYGEKLMAAGRAFRAENPDMSYAELLEHFLPPYKAEHGTLPFASLDDVLDHFDHVVKLVGIDHVGIGSDFDGVGDSLPTGLKDVADYPNLIEGLLNRGYSEDDIRKILGENLLRVWSQAEAYAASND